jgi:hypothetical protein
VQSQQLLTESQVFEDEVLSGPESADHPPEEMPERQEHGKNLIGTVRIELFAKSYILRAYDVLARHRVNSLPIIHQDVKHRVFVVPMPDGEALHTQFGFSNIFLDDLVYRLALDV